MPTAEGTRIELLPWVIHRAFARYGGDAVKGHPAWRASSAFLDGVPLANRARGGDMPVLMVHGMGPGTTAWLNFSRLLDLLPARCAVHLVDLAGFGSSGRLPAPPFFDVAFWLRQLDLAVDDILSMHGTPPLVVGYSTGGALALKLAARRQELQQIVAVGAPSGPPTQVLRAFWTAPTDLATLADSMRPLTAAQETPDPLVLRARFQPFLQPEYAAYFSEMLADPAECLKRLRLERAEAAAIAADVTIVHGREDRAFPVGQVLSGLLPLLPDADVNLLGACGHGVCTERPADIARLVNAVLERMTLP